MIWTLANVLAWPSILAWLASSDELPGDPPRDGRSLPPELDPPEEPEIRRIEERRRERIDARRRGEEHWF